VFPRPKLCGGLLTLKTVRAIEGTFGLDEARLLSGRAVHHASPGYEVFFRGDRVCRGEAPHPFLFSDRTVLDRMLLEQATRAGAEVLLGEAVASCDPDRGEVTTGSGRTFRARSVIGADGANSLVRRSFPRSGPDRAKGAAAWRHNLAATIEIALDPDELDVRPDHAMLYAGFIDKGYAWLFPGKGKCLAGICGLLRATPNIRPPFLDFLRHLGVRDPERRQLRGHPLPMGNYLSDPTRGRCLLAGDAAGIVEPLLGEGIYYAVSSGRLAALSLLGHGFGPAASCAYRRSLEASLFPELRWSRYWRSAINLSFKALRHLPIKLLVSGNQRVLEEMVHGQRSYRLLRKLDV
jgi:flavin-dependent dehydrogenase